MNQKFDIISRIDALNLGLKRYYTGNACKYGHISERYVSSGLCAECKRLDTKRWRDSGPKEGYNSAGKKLPTVEYLHECFKYVDGVIYWKFRPRSHFNSDKAWRIANTTHAGKIAGHYHTRNFYLEVRLGGTLYRGHRIIWKLLKGIEPDGIIDHIDTNPMNNKIENLRIATSRENARNSKKRAQVKNSTSEYKGVHFDGKSWFSVVTVNDSSVVIKCDSEVEAALDYDKRAKELFGEFALLNFPSVTHE